MVEALARPGDSLIAANKEARIVVNSCQSLLTPRPLQDVKTAHKPEQPIHAPGVPALISGTVGSSTRPGFFARLDRRTIASQRAGLAGQSLASCHLCAHHCGVNRLKGERGLCHAGAEARIFCAQTEVSDELELAPVFAIAFSGCDLRCDFCITGAESWNPAAGQSVPFTAVAEQARTALDRGARTIMFLGGEPTIHLPAVLETISHLPDDAILVWKTNAHGSADARSLLDGMFDVWVADYKFGNDGCAQRLARIDDYTATVRENLTWASEHTDLIVRHLVMPGHVDCCWRPVAEWLANGFPSVKVNLRCGFWPAWHAKRHHQLRQPTNAREAGRAQRIAEEFQLRLIN